MYKLHYFESATGAIPPECARHMPFLIVLCPAGLKFILTTDPKAPNLLTELETIYSDLYVEYVTKNPLYVVGSAIDILLFQQNVDRFIKSHPAF